MAKIRKVEQRKWESALQENLFWHELTVNILQHRVYFKVGAGRPSQACLAQQAPATCWIDWQCQDGCEDNQGMFCPMVSWVALGTEAPCSHSLYSHDTGIADAKPIVLNSSGWLRAACTHQTACAGATWLFPLFFFLLSTRGPRQALK